MFWTKEMCEVARKPLYQQYSIAFGLVYSLVNMIAIGHLKFDFLKVFSLRLTKHSMTMMMSDDTMASNSIKKIPSRFSNPSESIPLPRHPYDIINQGGCHKTFYLGLLKFVL